MKPSRSTIRRILLRVIKIGARTRRLASYLRSRIVGTTFVLLVMLLLVGRAPVVVLADDFFPGTEVEKSKFLCTYALGYETSILSNKLGYLENKVTGYTGGELFTLRFDLLTRDSPVYTRRASHKDFLVVPPLSEVFLGIYLYNETGHTVGVLNSWLFLGQYQKPSLSDIVKVSNTLYRNITYKTDGGLLTKGGESYEIGPLGNFMSGAVGELYGRVFSLGKVIAPVTVNLEHAECAYDSDGKVGTTLNFKLINEGVLSERIALESEAVWELLPLQELSINSLFVPGNSPSIEFRVLNEVTRCLEDVGEPADYKIPDRHSLVLARNDDPHWLWSASNLNVPTIESELQSQFCITRLPHTVSLPLPVCEVKPNYKITLPSSQELRVDSSVAVPFTVENYGGDDASSQAVHMSFSFPSYWENNVSFSLSQPSYQYNGETLLNNGVDLPSMSRGEVRTGYIIINQPKLLTREQGEPFTIVVSLEGVQSSLLVSPKTMQEIRIVSVTRDCAIEPFSVIIDVRLEGNVVSQHLKFPVSITGGDVVKETLEFRLEQELLQIDFESSGAVIIDFEGDFYPGAYKIVASRKRPLSGDSVGVLAVGGKTANGCRGCPVITTPLSNTLVQARDLIKKVDQKVLGVRTQKTEKVIEKEDEIKYVEDLQLPLSIEKMPSGKEAPVGRKFYWFIELIALSIATALFFIFLPRKSGWR